MEGRGAPGEGEVGGGVTKGRYRGLLAVEGRKGRKEQGDGKRGDNRSQLPAMTPGNVGTTEKINMQVGHYSGLARLGGDFAFLPSGAQPGHLTKTSGVHYSWLKL